MNITPPSDDARLIVTNRGTRATEPVQPSPKTTPIGENEEREESDKDPVVAKETPNQEDRRLVDRRKRNRRGEQAEVLLDTREKRERRTTLRRAGDQQPDSAQQSRPLRGIDLSG